MPSTDPAAGVGRAPRALDGALFAVAIAISAYVLFWPSPPAPPLFPYADKIVHAAVFGGLAWTGARAGLPVRPLMACLVAYAIGSEVVQHTLLPERSGDWTDAVADLVGAGAGLLLARPHRFSGRAR